VRSEKVGLGMLDFEPLNGRSSEMRCDAKRTALHMRKNAALAKAKI
jgi:hypothetical protein